jgi:hypothetical protein
MKMIELVLKGFDGSTDKTDDKIIWIGIPDNCDITLSDNPSNQIESISEVKIKFPTGIDLTIKEKTEPIQNRYTNYYKCPNCNSKWQDNWDSMCNDRCPNCRREIEPYKSEDLERGN